MDKGVDKAQGEGRVGQYEAKGRVPADRQYAGKPISASNLNKAFDICNDFATRPISSKQIVRPALSPSKPPQLYKYIQGGSFDDTTVTCHKCLLNGEVDPDVDEAIYGKIKGVQFSSGDYAIEVYVSDGSTVVADVKKVLYPIGPYGGRNYIMEGFTAVPDREDTPRTEEWDVSDQGELSGVPYQGLKIDLVTHVEWFGGKLTLYRRQLSFDGKGNLVLVGAESSKTIDAAATC